MSDDNLTCSYCGEKGHISREVNIGLSGYEVLCPDAGKWVPAKESQPDYSPIAEALKRRIYEGMVGVGKKGNL